MRLSNPDKKKRKVWQQILSGWHILMYYTSNRDIGGSKGEEAKRVGNAARVWLR